MVRRGGHRPAGLAAMRCQVKRASGRAHGAARALDRGERVCAGGDVGDHLLVRVRVSVRVRVEVRVRVRVAVRAGVRVRVRVRVRA